MAKFIMLSSILAVNTVAHLEYSAFRNTTQYTGTCGQVVFVTKTGTILSRVVNFDSSCGQSSFYWVRVNGEKYMIDHRVDVVKMTGLNASWFNKFPRKRPDNELIKIARRYHKDGGAHLLMKEYNTTLSDIIDCWIEGDYLLELASQRG